MCAFGSLFDFGSVGNEERWNIGQALYIKHLCGFSVSNQDFKVCYIRGGEKKNPQFGQVLYNLDD